MERLPIQKLTGEVVDSESQFLEAVDFRGD
jgi:hypothetical protein